MFEPPPEILADRNMEVNRKGEKMDNNPNVEDFEREKGLVS